MYPPLLITTSYTPGTSEAEANRHLRKKGARVRTVGVAAAVTAFALAGGASGWAVSRSQRSSPANDHWFSINSPATGFVNACKANAVYANRSGVWINSGGSVFRVPQHGGPDDIANEIDSLC